MKEHGPDLKLYRKIASLFLKFKKKNRTKTVQRIKLPIQTNLQGTFDQEGKVHTSDKKNKN